MTSTTAKSAAARTAEALVEEHARLIRKSGESVEQAYVRALDSDFGRRAMAVAEGDLGDPDGVAKAQGRAGLERVIADRGEAIRKSGETAEAAVARALREDPAAMGAYNALVSAG